MSSYRITTTNENWQGKSDPAERRRIQNRLNQRAYRERQRVASPSLPIQSEEDDKDEPGSEEESSSADSSSENDDDDDDDAEDDTASPTASSPDITSRQPLAAPTTTPIVQPWDELAQLINRNFLQAVAKNAQHLNLDSTALRNGTLTATPRLTNTSTPPATLVPTELQNKFPHDPLIDTISHARLRFNILRAIAKAQLDGPRFCASLRRSGALSSIHGESRRGGLIVWAQPEALVSWELSEGFVMLWGRVLLEGCEDLIAATNARRAKRGERGFPVALAKTSG